MHSSKRILTAMLSAVMAAGSVVLPNAAAAEEPDVVIGKYSAVKDSENTDEPSFIYDGEGNIAEVIPPQPAEEESYEVTEKMDDGEIVEWHTSFSYNRLTGILMAEPYPFEYSDSDFEPDSWRYYGDYRFYVNAGEDRYFIGGKDVSAWGSATPRVKLDTALAELYMNNEDFREYVDDGGKVTVSVEVYSSTSGSWMTEYTATSNEYECDFSGWSKRSSIPAPAKVYHISTSFGGYLIAEGVNGTKGYFYSTDGSNYDYSYENMFSGDASDITICSVDENGIPGEEVTLTPIEISKTYDANVSYSKRTGLYGLDDIDVKYPIDMLEDDYFEVTAENASGFSVSFSAEKASDGRYYVPKSALMLSLAEESFRRGSYSDSYDCGKKYEGDDQKFYITGQKKTRAYHGIESYNCYTAAAAISERQDDEPYITYDGADFDESIPVPTNIRRYGTSDYTITWDNNSDDCIGYIVVEEHTTPDGNYGTNYYSAETNMAKFQSIGGGYKYHITVYAVNSNGDLSLGAEEDFESREEQLIECPETWKSNISFDAETSTVSFDGYPVPDAIKEMYPNGYDDYYLTSPTSRWIGYSGGSGAQKMNLAGVFHNGYFSTTPFYGKNTVKAFVSGRVLTASGIRPVSEDSTEISYYGPKSIGKLAAPNGLGYYLTGFESYLDYYDENYRDHCSVVFDSIDGATGYIFKVESRFGVDYTSGLAPEFDFYSFMGDFKLSLAYVDADGNVSAFSDPIELSYDPNVLVGKSEITNITVNADNTVSMKWTAAKNAADYMISVESIELGTTRYYHVNGTGTSYTLPAAFFAGNYIAKVIAMDKHDSYSRSIYDYDGDLFTVEGETVLEPVTPKILVEAGDSKAVIAWAAVDGAESYRVFSVINGKYKLLDEIKNTAYTAEGLTNGQEIGFLVLSKVNGEWSTYTNKDIVYVTPKSAKSDKPVVTAEPTYGGANVTWGEVEGAVNYRVYTFVPGGKIRQFGSDTTETSMTVKGLKGGEKTGIIVLAQLANGKWTKYTDDDIAYVVPLDAVKPYLCVNPKGNGNYYLIWSSVPTSVRYKVMAREKGTSSWELVGATRSRCRITVELDPNKQYEFLVRGLNAKNKYTPMDADDIVSG